MFKDRFIQLQEALQNTYFFGKKNILEEKEALLLTYEMLFSVQQEKGKIYWIGNGGSAGIASHFSVDFLNVAKIPSFTFYDPSQMSCLANDYGYEKVFSIPLQRALSKEDLVVAISSSGESRNILEGVCVAKEKGAKVWTLSGFSNSNPLRSLGDINYWIDSKEYGLVEMGHFFLLHTVVDLWKAYSLKREASYAL